MKLAKNVLLILCTSIILYLLLFTICAFLIPSAHDDSYSKGFILQLEDLETNKNNDPKIIVFGASYVPFGVDKDYLEELSHMNSYTLGVSAGMGMKYIKETMEPYINTGDIIVMPLDIFDSGYYGMENIFITLDGERARMLDFIVTHPKQMISDGHIWIVSKLYGCFVAPVINGAKRILNYHENDDAYYIHWFSENGNYIKESYECIVPEAELSKRELLCPESFNDGMFEYINDLNAFCRQKGAVLVLTYTPMYKERYTNSDKEFKDVENYISGRCDAPFISDIKSSLYSEEYIYNGVKHLNTIGQHKYTHKLAEDLFNNGYIDMLSNSD